MRTVRIDLAEIDLELMAHALTPGTELTPDAVRQLDNLHKFSNPFAILELLRAAKWSVGFRCPECEHFSSTSPEAIKHDDSCGWRR